MNPMRHHILLNGENWRRAAIEAALIHHYPEFNANLAMRTRIGVVVESERAVHDFIFEYKELFDYSYWRTVDLSGKTPKIETHRPYFAGIRKDFVDVEWEFIIGYLSHPMLQEKIRRWANDRSKLLTIIFCHDNKGINKSYTERLRLRLPERVTLKTRDYDPESESRRMDELMEIAKYLHYFYKASQELKNVPTELPEDKVDAEWALLDETLRMSNIYNVMSIPHKMEILGHDRSDWNTFYALTASEIETLTAIEHNRWCVERLIQGMRPCTDRERKEIEDDMRQRLSDAEYTKNHPVSLKKRYKTERNAHYDLCAYSELGVDETGLPVTRYDRDLTAAIPLIVKTFSDRYGRNDG